MKKYMIVILALLASSLLVNAAAITTIYQNADTLISTVKKPVKYPDYIGINYNDKLYDYLNKVYTERGIKVSKSNKGVSIWIDTLQLDEKYLNPSNEYPKMSKYEIKALTYHSHSDIAIFINKDLSYIVRNGEINKVIFGSSISWV